MRPKTLFRPLAVLAAGLALAACAQQSPPQDRFYRLDAAVTATPPAAGPLTGTLEVSRPVADGVLSERPLVYQDAAGVLGRYRYDLWSDPPALLWQRALIDALRQAAIAGTVVGTDLRTQPDWSVRTHLSRFELLAAEAKVVVSAELAVSSVKDGRLILLRTYTAEQPCPAEPKAAAAALNRASADIMARFVADLTLAAGR